MQYLILLLCDLKLICGFVMKSGHMRLENLAENQVTYSIAFPQWIAGI